MARRKALILLLSLVGLTTTASLAMAHPGHDHKVLGTVTMAAPDHVMLKDRDGKDVTIKVTAETKVMKDKRRAVLGDVKVGDRVVVTAVTEKDQTIAKLIEIGSPRPTK